MGHRDWKSVKIGERRLWVDSKTVQGQADLRAVWVVAKKCQGGFIQEKGGVVSIDMERGAGIDDRNRDERFGG